MAQFTVKSSVQVRPDPDPASASIGTIAPGDQFTDPVRLGTWAKVRAADKDGNLVIGWIEAGHLQEIVGQTVKLHAEPLGAEFELVTGVVEQILKLANWRKVRVTIGAQVRTGWIDEQGEPGDGPPDLGPVTSADVLALGINEVYRDAILKAHEITKIDAAALAALIEAEAGKIKSGPHKGQWDRRAVSSTTSASGLTQFLNRTWLAHARDSGTLLNTEARKRGLVTSLDALVAGKEQELLDLRFDPVLSIVSAAEYGVANFQELDRVGLIPSGIGDDEKARYIYLAHHEGSTGAKKFLKRENETDLATFAKQVGLTRATELTAAHGGNVPVAYRAWLNSYMDDKIQPAKFRKAGTSPIVIASGSKTLEKFDGPAITMAVFGGRTGLVRETQQALADLGYLDPPADGKWGRVSNWAFGAFCKMNGLDVTAGFNKDVARALLKPVKQLPDIRPSGQWFDKVITYMNRKGYWISRFPGCPNIVYLEGVNADGTLNDDRPNVFNDLRVLFTVDESGKLVTRSWEATSEPGRHWTINPMNPGGAARIAFSQYKAWVIGTHLRGKASQHEALVQVEPVTVHRDLNRDFQRTNDKTDEGLFGINQHWGYDAPVDDLGNTSAGCLVGRTRAGHREFMAALKADPRFEANPAYKFMAAVLPGDKVMG